MAKLIQPSTEPQTWEDPRHCPFCTAELTDAGPGFMDHLERSPVCREGFELWRSYVAEDMRGDWSG